MEKQYHKNMTFIIVSYLHGNCNDGEYPDSSHPHLICPHQSLVMLQSESPTQLQSSLNTGNQLKYELGPLHTPENFVLHSDYRSLIICEPGVHSNSSRSSSNSNKNNKTLILKKYETLKDLRYSQQ
jgi:hypothetical protein